MKLKALKILEDYKNVILSNSMDVEYEDIQEAIQQIKDLEHYKDITKGLWGTDKPDILPENIRKEYFWEL